MTSVVVKTVTVAFENSVFCKGSITFSVTHRTIDYGSKNFKKDKGKVFTEYGIFAMVQIQARDSALQASIEQ